MTTRALPDPVAEPTITVERAAAVLGIGRRTAYDACARGEWPVLRVGRTVRVRTRDFLQKFGLLSPELVSDQSTEFESAK